MRTPQDISAVAAALASSAQHHREDGPTSSLGHVSMGKEQCAVVLEGEGNWLARHRTTKEMAPPHRVHTERKRTDKGGGPAFAAMRGGR